MSAGYFVFHVNIRGRHAQPGPDSPRAPETPWNGVAHAAYILGQPMVQFQGIPHAAYITGQELKTVGERTETFSYGKRERIAHSELSIPAGSPQWLREIGENQDHERLWNLVEASEKRKDAQIYREILMSINSGLFVTGPDGKRDVEGTKLLHTHIVRELVERCFTSRGMVASWAIHWDTKNPLNNPHAHIMMPFRPAAEHGFGNKERAWNRNEALESWKEVSAEIQNRFLDMLGAGYRVDHRSYERQGIDIEPEPKKFKGKRTNPEYERIVADRKEQLLKNADPVIVALGLHFKRPFSHEELIAYVKRWTKSRGLAERVAERIFASPELRPIGGKYMTHDMLAKQLRDELAPTIGKLDKMHSWSQLDQELWSKGFKFECHQKDGKSVYEIVDLRDQTRRVNAEKLDARFGEVVARGHFKENRQGYELGVLEKRIKDVFKDMEGEIWSKLRKEQAVDRAKFFSSYREALSEARHQVYREGTWTLSGAVGLWVTEKIWEKKLYRLERSQAEAAILAEIKVEKLRAEGKAVAEIWRAEPRVAEVREAVRREAPGEVPPEKVSQATKPEQEPPRRDVKPTPIVPTVVERREEPTKQRIVERAMDLPRIVVREQDNKPPAAAKESTRIDEFVSRPIKRGPPEHDSEGVGAPKKAPAGSGTISSPTPESAAKPAPKELDAVREKEAQLVHRLAEVRQEIGRALARVDREARDRLEAEARRIEKELEKVRPERERLQNPDPSRVPEQTRTRLDVLAAQREAELKKASLADARRDYEANYRHVVEANAILRTMKGIPGFAEWKEARQREAEREREQRERDREAGPDRGI